MTAVSWFRRVALFACLGAMPWASACRGEPTAAPDDPLPDDPFAAIPYADAPLPPATKVLLVAGGDDIANFAAEIIEQRALWIQAGLRADEIACYYAKPGHRALDRDAEQLAEVAPQLRDCYRADPTTVHAHLREAAGRAPPFLYLYVSSHGLPPLLRWKAEIDDPAQLGEHLDLRRGEAGQFDRHAIGLEAGDGPGLGDIDDMLAAYRQGAPVESLVFTPDTLAAAMEPLPPSSEAIVVLQACFSGGFIGRPDDDGPAPLTARPHTTILTATAPNRPSFGCGAGAHRTYYGGAFNRVLAETLAEDPRPPPQLPWAEIHQRVRFVVETMEVIDGETPSEPGLFVAPPTTEATVANP